MLPSDEKKHYTPLITFANGTIHEPSENVLSRKSLRYHNRLCPIIVLAERAPGLSIQTTGVPAVSKLVRKTKACGIR